MTSEKKWELHQLKQTFPYTTFGTRITELWSASKQEKISDTSQSILL